MRKISPLLKACLAANFHPHHNAALCSLFHSHRTMERSPVDWNSSRSLRSSSRLHQQHSGLSGGGSGTSQTHQQQQQQQPPTHANHNHMSGVPQPPPPASTSRSAHKGTTITTAVTPEETPTTRRSKRISAMAHDPYHGSEYPSSSASGKSKSLLLGGIFTETRKKNRISVPGLCVVHLSGHCMPPELSPYRSTVRN